MEKKNYFFSLYSVEEMENDIEIKGTFDTVEDLTRFLKVSKQYLYSLGIKKKRNLKIEIVIDNTKYMIYVDSDEVC